MEGGGWHLRRLEWRHHRWLVAMVAIGQASCEAHGLYMTTAHGSENAIVDELISACCETTERSIKDSYRPTQNCWRQAMRPVAGVCNKVLAKN